MSDTNRLFSTVIATRVISEPGDMTLYDYIYINSGDDYMFVPFLSTFEFPQKLNYWDIVDINTIEDCNNFINDSNKVNIFTNSNTLMECINLIKEVHETK